MTRIVTKLARMNSKIVSTNLNNSTASYSAKRMEPRMIRIPTPPPTTVGQSVPEEGNAGADGVGVGAEVPGQVQLVTVGQDLSRQNPW